MDLSYIDYLANFHPNIFRRAQPAYKLLFTAVIVASVIILRQPLPILGIYLLLISLAALMRLPLFKIWLFSLYPLLFVALFLFASYGGLVNSLTLVLKVISISLALIFLIITTPYPRVFHALGHFLPSILNSALYLTYRAIFIFLRLMSNLWSAIRLRGGLNWRQPLDSLKDMASVFGFLIVRALDLSEALSENMKLRGFEGQIHYHVPHRGIKELFEPANMLVLGLTFGLASAVIYFQF